MPSIFQNFVASVGKQFQNRNQPITPNQQGFRGPYLMDQAFNAGLDDGIYKAVIPQFLYKPPFGYPLSKDIPEIRRLAKTAHVSMIVNTICNELAGLDWNIVGRDGENVPEEVITQTKSFFYNPNSNAESFDFIIRKLVRDILEIDAGVLVKVRNAKDEFLEMYVYDGATFTKNCNIHGVIPVEMGYFQYGWATGSRPTPFNRNEIVYIMANPRADSIYGRSNIENLFDVLRLLTYGVESNLEYFTDNNVPRGVFKMAGGTAADVDAFQKSWQEMLRRKDAGGNWKRYFQKMPVMTSEGEFERIGFSNLELELLEQQKWFSRLAFACFGVTPDELGFTEDSNRAVTLGQSAIFKRKAIRPLVQLLEYHFNTQVIDDLPWVKDKFEEKVLFEFDKFDLQEEISKRQLFWGDISSGLRTVDEIREELNLAPIGSSDRTDMISEEDWEEGTEDKDKAEVESTKNTTDEEDVKKEPEIKGWIGFKTKYFTSGLEGKALTSESPVDPKAFEKVKKKESEIEETYFELEREILLAIDAAQKGQLKLGESAVEKKAIGKEFIDRVANMFNLFKIKDTIVNAIKEHFLDGNDNVEEKVNRNLLPNSEALDFLQKHTFENVKNLEEDTRGKLRQELERALINGTSQEELAGKIRDVLYISLGRAKTIAVTELMRAKNLGELNAWRESGIQVKKKVIAVIDSKTSEICRHLNGKELTLDKNYEFEGQSYVGPPFHPNCRSILAYTFESGKK